MYLTKLYTFYVNVFPRKLFEVLKKKPVDRNFNKQQAKCFIPNSYIYMYYTWELCWMTDVTLQRLYILCFAKLSSCSAQCRRSNTCTCRLHGKRFSDAGGRFVRDQSGCWEYCFRSKVIDGYLNAVPHINRNFSTVALYVHATTSN